MRIFFFLILFFFSNFAFADHKDFRCSDPFDEPPWNDFFLHNDIFAPWNDIFCTKESVNNYLRENNVSGEYFWR